MIDVLGPEKRRRRTTQEKIAIVQQSFEPGMKVSLLPGNTCGSQPVISLAQAIPGREVLLLWPQESRSFLPLNLLLP